MGEPLLGKLLPPLSHPPWARGPAKEIRGPLWPLVLPVATCWHHSATATALLQPPPFLLLPSKAALLAAPELVGGSSQGGLRLTRGRERVGWDGQTEGEIGLEVYRDRQIA